MVKVGFLPTDSDFVCLPTTRISSQNYLCHDRNKIDRERHRESERGRERKREIQWWANSVFHLALALLFLFISVVCYCCRHKFMHKINIVRRLWNGIITITIIITIIKKYPTSRFILFTYYKGIVMNGKRKRGKRKKKIRKEIIVGILLCWKAVSQNDENMHWSIAMVLKLLFYWIVTILHFWISGSSA